MRAFWSAGVMMVLGYVCGTARLLADDTRDRRTFNKQGDYFTVQRSPCYAWQEFNAQLILPLGNESFSYQLASQTVVDTLIYYKGQKIDEFKVKTPRPSMVINCSTFTMRGSCLDYIKSRVRNMIDAESINNCKTDEG